MDCGSHQWTVSDAELEQGDLVSPVQVVDRCPQLGDSVRCGFESAVGAGAAVIASSLLWDQVVSLLTIRPRG